MSNKTKLFLTISILFSILIPLFAFEWPQDNVQSSKINTYFGQKRAQTISNSITFSESENVKATDDGNISIIITEHDDGFNWFESPLGTAVIISHEDSLQSVYGNLDTYEINPDILKSPKIKKGTRISTTGNSGWQEDNSFLEFQVLDSKNNNFVNPLILMPRLNSQNELTISKVQLKNKFGKYYDLSTQTQIPSGIYKIFKSRQNLAIPYKISIAVNGIESEQITFDTLKMDQNDLAIEGQTFYTVSDIYPNETNMLIGEIYLPNGQNTLRIIQTDFAGNKTSKTFKISTY